MPFAILLGTLGWFALRRLTSGYLERTTLHGYLGLAAVLVLLVASFRKKASRSSD
jgi:hypothetical protein